MNIVLQKYIAETGLCSRRKAEELIKNKKVTINGKVARLGDRVKDEDKVKIEEKKIELAKDKKYIILNKPIGYVCTNRKFKDEKNIFELIESRERLFVVGRLDKDSKGLVLLTNDGDFAQKLIHPKFEHEKEYVVKISSPQFLISKQFINELIFNFKKGIDIGADGGLVKMKDVKYLDNNKFKIILTEGKKRQIRRMFKKYKLEVIDLERIRIGKIKLKNLKEGRYRFLNKNEI